MTSVKAGPRPEVKLKKFLLCSVHGNRISPMSTRILSPRQSAALPEHLQQKGRGAKSNAAGRFERHTAEPFDDGWETGDKPAPRLDTTLIRDASRSIVSTNDSPDIGFNRSINPYRGCEHGWLYSSVAHIRATEDTINHARHHLHPLFDAETRAWSKPRPAIGAVSAVL
jgi:hypothetical protein